MRSPRFTSRLTRLLPPARLDSPAPRVPARSAGSHRTRPPPAAFPAGRASPRTRATVSGAALHYTYVPSSPLLSPRFPFLRVIWHAECDADPPQILGAGDLVDRRAMVDFLADCQFKFGGLAKAPGERPGTFLPGYVALMELTFPAQIRITPTCLLRSSRSSHRNRPRTEAGSSRRWMLSGTRRKTRRSGRVITSLPGNGAFASLFSRTDFLTTHP